MKLRDLLAEATSGISWRPARSALTALGTVLGTAALVAVLGFTATAHDEVNEKFNALLATSVTLQDAKPALAATNPAFPDGFERTLGRLRGVTAAGAFWQVQIGDAHITTGNAAYEQQIIAPNTATVDAATPDAFSVLQSSFSAGGPITAFEEAHHEQVAVLGSSVATSLGLPSLSEQPAVFIGGQPFLVVGILRNDQRRPDALLSVMIPQSTAVRTWGYTPDGAQAIVATLPGAAGTVASEIPAVLHPNDPERVLATAPPNATLIRNAVNADLNDLFLILAGISLLIGMVGIGNTTLVSVLERTDEIGLRRSLGAQRRHIAGQFLIESGLLGILGGVIGCAIGVIAIVVVSTLRHWIPALDITVIALAPLAGMATGLIAGLYPALKVLGWSQSRPCDDERDRRARGSFVSAPLPQVPHRLRWEPAQTLRTAPWILPPG